MSRNSQYGQSKGTGYGNGKPYKNRAARPVADLVSHLLDPVIERRAGMTIDLIAAWEEIAGERHARFSRPEKLNWPRRASDDDPFEPAVLHIACEQVHALFLQHDSGPIIERINSYFGFAAVGRVKISQKPLPATRRRRAITPPTVSPGRKARLDEILETVTDPTLRAALEKMGRGVFSKGS